MAQATLKIEFPRRQAIYRGYMKVDGRPTIAGTRVFVWPMPTSDGLFIVEREDGQCHTVQSHELTFLGSKELFDQYDWSEDA